MTQYHLPDENNTPSPSPKVPDKPIILPTPPDYDDGDYKSGDKKDK